MLISHAELYLKKLQQQCLYPEIGNLKKILQDLAKL